MPLVVPLPANVVLAAFTLFSELMLLPIARWISERYEGKQLHKELMRGGVVEVKRADIGPLRIPMGRKSPFNIVIAMLLSLGVIAAITFAEYGMKPGISTRDVMAEGTERLIHTGDRYLRQGIIRNSDPANSQSWHSCVEVGNLPCHEKRQSYNCVRSIYFRGVLINGTKTCVDKVTGLLRNASDIDLVTYEGRKLFVKEPGNVLEVQGGNDVQAQRATFKFENRTLSGVVIYRRGYSGVNVVWNSSAVFVSLHIIWEGLGISREGFEVDTGVFPNGQNKVDDYLDSILSTIAQSLATLRMGAIGGLLFNIHYTSTERSATRFRYTTSEYIETTLIEPSSYITLAVVFVCFLMIRILSIGQRSELNTFNGLSRQYDDDVEERGRSLKPDKFVTIAIVDEKDGLSQHIGSTRGRPSVRRDPTIPLDGSGC